MPSHVDEATRETPDRRTRRKARGKRRLGRPSSVRSSERDPDAGLARLLADWCGLWDLCGRPACRRARSCRIAAAPCFGEQIATVSALLGEDPAFRRLQVFADEAGDGIDG